MGTCKGNLGNLVQHWTLCETLKAAEQVGHPDLFFLCTHSMAPWSQPEARTKGTTIFHKHFDAARDRLFSNPPPQRVLCAYEQAWSTLSPREGLLYPSSACFAVNRWKGGLSLWLCETEGAIAAEISEWWNRRDFPRELLGKRVSERQWQQCFRERPPMLFEQAAKCNVAIIECDPDMVLSRRGTRQSKLRVIYPEGLDLIRSVTDLLPMPVVLQISSYSTEGGNTPDVVERAVTAAMMRGGFRLQTQVIAENTMTSLVYAKDIELWNGDSQRLSTAFDEWLAGN